MNASKTRHDLAADVVGELFDSLKNRGIFDKLTTAELADLVVNRVAESGFKI